MYTTYFRVSDGSDHRACCSDRGVPRRCLEWCRGEPVNNKMCVLSYSKSILACFHELRGIKSFIGAPGIIISIGAQNRFLTSTEDFRIKMEYCLTEINFKHKLYIWS